MTSEWLRDERVILQRSIADNPMSPEGIVVIMGPVQAPRAISRRTTSTSAQSRARSR